MSEESESKATSDSTTEEEKRNNVIRLAFDGDPARFQEFCEAVKSAVPEASAAVLRGSAVTGRRWKDDAEFDADGEGTSDLDLTLVGSDVLRYYSLEGHYIPGMHSRPLCDEDPNIAPELVPLRNRLCKMVGRPVNIQASRNWVQQFRGDLLHQPYLTLFGSLYDE